MHGAERRLSPRRRVELPVYVRKRWPDGRSSVLGFRTADLAVGGLLLVTEDLTLFDVGETIQLMVDDGGRYRVTDARVVRSARIRRDADRGDGRMARSGFGIRFCAPEASFRDMLRRRLQPC